MLKSLITAIVALLIAPFGIDGGATTSASQITIDTTQPGTHTIEYVATDQNGLEGTATRTLIVVVPATDDSDATTTDASSTSS